MTIVYDDAQNKLANLIFPGASSDKLAIILREASRTQDSGPNTLDVAIIGDSYAGHNTSNVNGTSNWGVNTGNRYMAYGYLSMLRMISRQSFNFDGTNNYGVVGETTPQILLRIAGMLQNSTAQTIFYQGGINDRGTANLTLQQTKDAVSTSFNMILDTGRTLFVPVPGPVGDSSFTSQRLSATQVANHLMYRRWLNETYSNTPGVSVIDTYPGIADVTSTTGDAVVGQLYEGLHPSTGGANTYATNIKPVTSLIYPPRETVLFGSNSDIYGASNPNGSLTGNPFVTGTGGTPGTGGSGSIADSWTGGNGGDTGHTRTYSKVTSNGKAWQQCVFAGTPTSSGDAVVALQNFTSNIAVGDNLRAVCEVEWDASVTGIQTFRLRIVDTGSFVNVGVDMDYSGSIGFWPTSAGSGILMTPPGMITSTNQRVALEARLISGTACAGTIRFRSMGVMKL
jgi:hypothetical protein